jgi:hypothetical protein
MNRTTLTLMAAGVAALLASCAGNSGSAAKTAPGQAGVDHVAAATAAAGTDLQALTCRH